MDTFQEQEEVTLELCKFSLWEGETVANLKITASSGWKRGVLRTLFACFYLWKQLLVCFSSSDEDCHRTLRHFLPLSLKWLNSWFLLKDCAQIPSCLSWKCALSSAILVFIPQEMAASLIFFCSVTKIRKHNISDGGEILKDS